jgi:hypothetical protein
MVANAANAGSRRAEGHDAKLKMFSRNKLIAEKAFWA